MRKERNSASAFKAACVTDCSFYMLVRLLPTSGTLRTALNKRLGLPLRI